MNGQEMILNQMAQLLQKAQMNPTDSNVREQLTAIKALCDVALQLTESQKSNGTDLVASVKLLSNEAHTMNEQIASQQRNMPKRAHIERQSDSIFDF